ncbi:MAG: hypothetical protein N2Z65_05040 [Clostridiales bacterium]|nr:hypothetical protein [Clostridiales bacterium]
MNEKGRLKLLLNLAIKYKYALLVLVFGLILMIIPSGGSKKDIVKKSDVKTVSSYDVNTEEKKLETMLSSIDGVGRVKIALTLKSGAESVYALDQSENIRENGQKENGTFEKDSNSRPMVVSSESGGESPLKVKENLPEYRGALVICDGADDPNVKLMVTDAIRSLTGVTSDNISVIKMKD